MKLIEVARHQRDILNDGMGWVAVWKVALKNGKASWFSEDVFPDDGTKNDEPIFDDEQKARLAEIVELDNNAVLLNGYMHSWIGSADEPLNAASIAKGIENHYEMHNALLKDYLAGEDETDESETKSTQAETKTETPTSNAPDTIAIELPLKGANQEILTALLNSKATLIKTALGEDGIGELPIEFADGKVKFNWLRFGASEEAVTAWSTFLAAAVKYSKTAKRVTAKDGEVENQKFSFRVFLTKLKLDGAENKWYRHFLLRNLTGDSAFATAESKQRWLEKHSKKTETEEVAE
ncbi:hypothetical protein AGMMS49975_13750 [Clostridia bacterium]|nr:hypothetical protein AGMMS49975_13750 [Clostridia bacterium]